MGFSRFRSASAPPPFIDPDCPSVTRPGSPRSASPRFFTPDFAPVARDDSPPPAPAQSRVLLPCLANGNTFEVYPVLLLHPELQKTAGPPAVVSYMTVTWKAPYELALPWNRKFELEHVREVMSWFAGEGGIPTASEILRVGG